MRRSPRANAASERPTRLFCVAVSLAVFGSPRRENVARHARTTTALSRAHFRSAPFSVWRSELGSFNENGERHLDAGRVGRARSASRGLPAAADFEGRGRCDAETA